MPRLHDIEFEPRISQVEFHEIARSGARLPERHPDPLAVTHEINGHSAT